MVLETERCRYSEPITEQLLEQVGHRALPILDMVGDLRMCIVRSNGLFLPSVADQGNQCSDSSITCEYRERMAPQAVLDDLVDWTLFGSDGTYIKNLMFRRRFSAQRNSATNFELRKLYLSYVSGNTISGFGTKRFELVKKYLLSKGLI